MPAPGREKSPHPYPANLFLDDVTFLRDVQTIQELSDILVSNSADLLNIGGALRDVLERVTEQLELILLVLGGLDFNAWLHDDSADDLFTKEVSDFNFV